MSKEVASGEWRGASDYFALFGFDKTFALDEHALKTKYFTLQREAHPDRVAGADTSEKIAAISRATAINKGYQVLRDPVARAEYLLSLEGIRADKPCVDMLMEAMQQREYLEEADTPEALDAFKRETMERITQSIDAIEAAFAQSHMEAVKQEVTRLKYLSKLAEEIRLKSLEINNAD